MSMSFYQTHMGARFFQKHVPELIKALQQLAVPQKQVAVSLDTSAPAEIIRLLYHGELEFSATNPAADMPEYIKWNDAIKDCRKRLTDKYGSTFVADLEAYDELLIARASVEFEQTFTQGFRTAVQLLSAGLSHTP